MKTSNKIMGKAYALSAILNYAEEMLREENTRIDDIKADLAELSQDDYWKTPKENDLEQAQAKKEAIETIIKTLEKGI